MLAPLSILLSQDYAHGYEEYYEDDGWIAGPWAGSDLAESLYHVIGYAALVAAAWAVLAIWRQQWRPYLAMAVAAAVTYVHGALMILIDDGDGDWFGAGSLTVLSASGSLALVLASRGSNSFAWWCFGACSWCAACGVVAIPVVCVGKPPPVLAVLLLPVLVTLFLSSRIPWPEPIASPKMRRVLLIAASVHAHLYFLFGSRFAWLLGDFYRVGFLAQILQVVVVLLAILQLAVTGLGPLAVLWARSSEDDAAAPAVSGQA